MVVNPEKPIDVVAVGSWTNFDHLFRVDRLPQPGDTVQIVGPSESIEQVYKGGCAPNNAVAAAKLGSSTALISVVGRDFRDLGYQAYLEELGVDLQGVIIVEEELSGHTYLFNDPNGDAISLAYLGVAARQDEFEPNTQVLSAAKVVVINYLFDSFTLHAARIAGEAGAQVIISGPLLTTPEFVGPMLGAAHILVCTYQELAQLVQHMNLSSRSNLFEHDIQSMVITQGVKGSLVLTPDSEVHIPVVPASQTPDPAGAGDGFVGGLASGLSFGYSLIEAVRLGAAVASFVVEAFGCQTNLPTFEQAAQRVQDTFGVLLEQPLRE